MSNKFCLPLEKIDEFSLYLIGILEKNSIVFLDGEVGAGKTTLVRSLVKQLGISNSVTSPTFSLQQCYGDTIFHYDLYRLGDEEFLNLGLHEELDRQGWHLIEWASEQLKEFLITAGYNTTTITILPHEQGRCYIIGDKCTL